MNSPEALETKLRKALQSDRTLMLGLAECADSHFKPMTVQFDGDEARGPLWCFTAKDTDLVRSLGSGHPAVALFASKGHDLFATIHGTLVLDNDRATIDRLWNHFVAAWYPEGKADPSLQLIRLDPTHAQVWLNETSLFTGVKMLLGMDVKADYQDKVAVVSLDDEAKEPVVSRNA